MYNHFDCLTARYGDVSNMNMAARPRPPRFTGLTKGILFRVIRQTLCDNIFDVTPMFYRNRFPLHFIWLFFCSVKTLNNLNAHLISKIESQTSKQ